MITIVAEDTKVKLVVSLDIPWWDKRDFIFHWDCNTRWAAGLLAQYMRDKYNEAVRKARKEAYEQGWNDAKSKRRKEDFFRGWL
jgi:hypothetical protein